MLIEDLHAPKAYFPVKFFITITLNLITLLIHPSPTKTTHTKQKMGKDLHEHF